MLLPVSASAGDSPDPRPFGCGCGEAVRAALGELDLSGSGRLLAPVVVQLADAMDAAGAAGDVDLVIALSARYVELVNRLELDPGSLPSGPVDVSPRDRARAAAEDGPR